MFFPSSDSLVESFIEQLLSNITLLQIEILCTFLSFKSVERLRRLEATGNVSDGYIQSPAQHGT